MEVHIFLKYSRFASMIILSLYLCLLVFHKQFFPSSFHKVYSINLFAAALSLHFSLFLTSIVF